MGRADGQGDATLTGERSAVPLYHRLFVILREKLTSGAFAAGDLLPTELELGRIYGVSRVTAKRALDELAAEGLVERSRGRGTVATGKTFEMIGGTPLVAGMKTLLTNLETIGTVTQADVLSFDVMDPPKSVYERLRLTPGSKVLKAVRLRRWDGHPLALSTTYVHPAIADHITPEKLTASSLIRIISQSGIEIVRVDQAVSASLADPVTAGILEIPVGSALLRIQRTFFAAGDMPVDHVEMLYPAERFEFRLTLTGDH